MNVAWSDCALDRLHDYADLVFREAGAKSALKWLEGLESRVRILNAHPEAGREVPEVRRKDIRGLIYRNRARFSRNSRILGFLALLG